MNNEIKEMLELHIKNDIDLLPKNQKTVLEYITNLQETIDFQDKWLEYYKDFISENNIKDYKSRIEKAVDFINKHCVNHKLSKEFGFKVYTMMVTDELEKVMKILENGRSDE